MILPKPLVVRIEVGDVSTNTIFIGGGGTRLLTGGGVAWTGTGFDFIVSAATYLINDNPYASAQTPLTLSAADPLLDRIDVFALNTSGNAVVVEGVPGGPALEPSVDPATQLRLVAVSVPAASTEPVVVEEEIYLENTEWTTSTNSAGTINLASTNNPYAGTKDVEGTATVTGNNFTAVKPAAGTLKLSDYDALILFIRSKAAWAAAKGIAIFWLNGVTPSGVSVALKSGTFGFNSSNTTTYQQVVIPTSLFNTGTADVTTVRFQISGSGGSIGWYLDNILLQSGGGGGGGTGGGDFSTNVNTSTVGEIVTFADTTGKLGTPAVPAGGWTPPTGTPLRTGYSTTTATVNQVSQNLKALIDDLTTRGLIGP